MLSPCNHKIVSDERLHEIEEPSFPVPQFKLFSHSLFNFYEDNQSINTATMHKEGREQEIVGVTHLLTR
jgi:hypothetical protein